MWTLREWRGRTGSASAVLYFVLPQLEDSRDTSCPNRYRRVMELHVHSPTHGVGTRYLVNGVTYELPLSYEVWCEDLPDFPYRIELSVVMTDKGYRAARVTVAQLRTGQEFAELHDSEREEFAQSVEGLPETVARFDELMDRLQERTAGRPDGPDVTAAALRRVPVKDLVGRSIEVAVAAVEEILPVEDASTEQASAHRERTKADDDNARKVARESRHRIDDTHLALVARHYREAAAVGLDPSRTVAQRMGVARSTARNWVSAARKRGHLGPAPATRRAGEASEGGER